MNFLDLDLDSTSLKVDEIYHVPPLRSRKTLHQQITSRYRRYRIRTIQSVLLITITTIIFQLVIIIMVILIYQQNCQDDTLDYLIVGGSSFSKHFISQIPNDVSWQLLVPTEVTTHYPIENSKFILGRRPFDDDDEWYLAPDEIGENDDDIPSLLMDYVFLSGRGEKNRREGEDGNGRSRRGSTRENMGDSNEREYGRYNEREYERPHERNYKRKYKRSIKWRAFSSSPFPSSPHPSPSFPPTPSPPPHPPSPSFPPTPSHPSHSPITLPSPYLPPEPAIHDMIEIIEYYQDPPDWILQIILKSGNILKCRRIVFIDDLIPLILAGEASIPSKLLLSVKVGSFHKINQDQEINSSFSLLVPCTTASIICRRKRLPSSLIPNSWSWLNIEMNHVCWCA